MAMSHVKNTSRVCLSAGSFFMRKSAGLQGEQPGFWQISYIYIAAMIMNDHTEGDKKSYGKKRQPSQGKGK